MTRKEKNREFNLNVGQRVRLLREHLRLTRGELSERLGISEFFLREIELGRKGVSNQTLCRLAGALCTTTDYLLMGREEFSDVSEVTAMLSTIEKPLLTGAEDLLKAYLNSISLIQSKLEKQKNSEI